LKYLPFREILPYFWFKLFIDNKFSWAFWSRIFYVKCSAFCIKHGRVNCYGNVDIYRAPLSTIEIGDNVSIVSKSSRGNASSLYTISRIRTYTPTAKIYIGSNTGMNGVSITSRTKSIYIGSNCRIAPNTVIVDSDYHSMIPPESRLQNPGFEFDKDVVINENVWIGMRSIILKGVTIGKNSVIAAGSVVVKDIPEDCLAAGVPAIVVKKL
jgi:acetyltransferase-like isoleucine patch superfamily enzyme